MLYYLFVDQADLLTVNSQVYRSYINAFYAYYYLYTHPEDFYTDPDLESKASDSKSNKDLDKQVDKYPLADFEAFAYQGL